MCVSPAEQKCHIECQAKPYECQRSANSELYGMLATYGAEIENTDEHDPNEKGPKQPPKRFVLSSR